MQEKSEPAKYIFEDAELKAVMFLVMLESVKFITFDHKGYHQNYKQMSEELQNIILKLHKDILEEKFTNGEIV